MHNTSSSIRGTVSCGGNSGFPARMTKRPTPGDPAAAAGADPLLLVRRRSAISRRRRQRASRQGVVRRLVDRRRPVLADQAADHRRRAAANRRRRRQHQAVHPERRLGRASRLPIHLPDGRWRDSLDLVQAALRLQPDLADDTATGAVGDIEQDVTSAPDLPLSEITRRGLIGVEATSCRCSQ